VRAASFALVPRGGHPDFLDLPWSEPLGEWIHERLVRMAHGHSRHVVRFVAYDERVYALKETTTELATREFRALRHLTGEGLPAVEATGVVTGRSSAEGSPLGSVLITRFLDYALPYTYLIGTQEGTSLRARLLDAGAVLLVRLHLEGVFWGDCSLGNVLFRRDAGALMAYLVDAETVDVHDAPLDGRLREHDIELALENVVGGLYDLQAAGRLGEDVDPVAIADALRGRYDSLWDELTHVDRVGADERHQVEARIRRLNDLGFDVEELVVEAGGGELQIRPTVVEEGHHARELRRRTGLEVQENQARRLLGDIAGYRAWLEREAGAPVPEAVASARWLAEIYEPIVNQVPPELRGRREPAEIFHELLEHRWILSEQAGREVENDEALASYLASVLPGQAEERTLLADD
jgi:Domain of unknown function (DUF4032)/Lipopolysaccharide kinase (Kdo/WaaP) family